MTQPLAAMLAQIEITRDGHILFTVFFLLLGACIGSFLNVVVWRLPRGESLVSPPSHCPKCQHKLAWYDNVPVLGWIMLRGRCRYCQQPISMRYPIIEAITGLMFALYYVLIFVFHFGPCILSVDSYGETAARGSMESIFVQWPHFGLYLFMLAGLLAASLIDAELFIIPTSIPHLMALIGIVVHAIVDRPSMAGSLNASAPVGALAAGAGVGLLLSLAGLRRKWPSLSQSFPQGEPVLNVDREAMQREIEQARRAGEVLEFEALPPEYTSAQIRAEIRKEMKFLLPPLILGAIWLLLCTRVGPVQRWWGGVMEQDWISGFLGAVWGALVGGFVVWLTRILGTLAFGRVAMGLGDVHLMFGVGAVIGAASTTLAFFIAPFLGILVALYRLIVRSHRELPYGPYLSLAAAAVLLFSCDIAIFLNLPAAGLGLAYLLRGWFGGAAS